MILRMLQIKYFLLKKILIYQRLEKNKMTILKDKMKKKLYKLNKKTNFFNQRILKMMKQENQICSNNNSKQQMDSFL